MHASHGEVRKKIAGGAWSDETQQDVHKAIEGFAEDFGYDLDEEGEALEEAAAA
jgi:F-type H+/Na+-transporting ATPase subunit alpha